MPQPNQNPSQTRAPPHTIKSHGWWNSHSSSHVYVKHLPAFSFQPFLSPVFPQRNLSTKICENMTSTTLLFWWISFSVVYSHEFRSQYDYVIIFRSQNDHVIMLVFVFPQTNLLSDSDKTTQGAPYTATATARTCKRAANTIYSPTLVHLIHSLPFLWVFPSML